MLGELAEQYLAHLAQIDLGAQDGAPVLEVALAQVEEEADGLTLLDGGEAQQQRALDVPSVVRREIFEPPILISRIILSVGDGTQRVRATTAHVAILPAGGARLVPVEVALARLLDAQPQ